MQEQSLRGMLPAVCAPNNRSTHQTSHLLLVLPLILLVVQPLPLLQLLCPVRRLSSRVACKWAQVVIDLLKLLYHLRKVCSGGEAAQRRRLSAKYVDQPSAVRFRSAEGRKTVPSSCVPR